MSVDYKKSNNGKCPVMHGGVTKAGESNTARLWPNSINSVSYTHLRAHET